MPGTTAELLARTSVGSQPRTHYLSSLQCKRAAKTLIPESQIPWIIFQLPSPNRSNSTSPLRKKVSQGFSNEPIVQNHFWKPQLPVAPAGLFSNPSFSSFPRLAPSSRAKGQTARTASAIPCTAAQTRESEEPSASAQGTSRPWGHLRPCSPFHSPTVLRGPSPSLGILLCSSEVLLTSRHAEMGFGPSTFIGVLCSHWLARAAWAPPAQHLALSSLCLRWLQVCNKWAGLNPLGPLLGCLAGTRLQHWSHNLLGYTNSAMLTRRRLD